MKTNTSPKPRFKLLQFTNRSGSASWRVAGIKRDGTRIRENFSEVQSAKCRLVDLESEFLARAPEEARLRATRLTDAQIHLAEIVFPRLKADGDILFALEKWLSSGQKEQVQASVHLDEAVKSYLEWLEATPTLRPATKRNWRIRVSMFGNSVPNYRMSDITTEVVEKYLAGRNTSPLGKDTDKRALSRFFSWNIERPRRWMAVNPCREIHIERNELPPPTVLSVDDCAALMRAAEAHKGGRLTAYFAVCLFGSLRPTEASRLTWDGINLHDDELRLEGAQSKTGRARTIKIGPTLHTWLAKYEGQPFHPSNWRKDFDAIRKVAGFNNQTKPWANDVLRHTGISHFFRQSGSYGLTAEFAGNSEQIIKSHYQGRVNSEDTKRFYSILPKTRKPAKKS